MNELQQIPVKVDKDQVSGFYQLTAVHGNILQVNGYIKIDYLRDGDRISGFDFVIRNFSGTVELQSLIPVDPKKPIQKTTYIAKATIQPAINKAGVEQIDSIIQATTQLISAPQEGIIVSIIDKH